MRNFAGAFTCWATIVGFCVSQCVAVPLTVDNIDVFLRQKAKYPLSNRQFTSIKAAALEKCKGADLVLQDNKLVYLPADLFAYNAKFESLYFQNNSIANVHPSVFSKLTNVQYISLGRNKLSAIHEDLFKSNLKLKKLYLGFNKIKSIHANAFANLRSLEELHIDNNRLKSLDSGMFRTTAALGHLLLQRNKLAEIDYRKLRIHLPQLEFISLTGNHFNCSHASAMVDYLQSEGITIVEFERTWARTTRISCVADELVDVARAEAVDGRCDWNKCALFNSTIPGKCGDALKQFVEKVVAERLSERLRLFELAWNEKVKEIETKNAKMVEDLLKRLEENVYPSPASLTEQAVNTTD